MCPQLELPLQLKLADKSLEELLEIEEVLSALIAEVEYRYAEKEEFEVDNLG